MAAPISPSKPSTFLVYRSLSPYQQSVLYYLLPSILTSLVYILNISADGCLALQHWRDEQGVTALLTLLLTVAPVAGALLFTLSNTDEWPEDRWGWWLARKIMGHVLFPVWAMYRFAEQLFWSIEAVRTTDDEERKKCMARAERNSIFELYHFLQAYLQAAPQILLQMHFIFRQSSNFNKETVDMQVFSIIISLIRMAMTTANYQRFKSQKPTGRQYPWKKLPKPIRIHTIQETYHLDNIQEEEEYEHEHVQEENDEKSEENLSKNEENFITFEENSDAEADQDDYNLKTHTPVTRKSSELSVTSSQFETKIEAINNKLEDKIDSSFQTRRSSGLSVTSSQFETKIETKNEENVDEQDFSLPVKIVFHRGLPEDDAAGKIVSFFWWFCFILPRMLALSAFAYFYHEIWYLCGAHYLICLAFLLYDARTSDIPYYRAIFLLFTAYVYMFCLIEFKIKFKKIKFIYNGFFFLVYLENLIMTLVWYNGEEFIFSDWWYRYIFYLIIGSSVISILSMFLYMCTLKPKKVVLNQGYRNSKVL